MTREEREAAISTLEYIKEYCHYEYEKETIDKVQEALEQEPTTKNDLPHCQHTDEEIAKSFIEDVEAVKDQLPKGQQMEFPNTFDEFAEDYGFKDDKEIYTNGSELIPVFRVKQWLEHISTTKNDLGILALLKKTYADLCNCEGGEGWLKIDGKEYSTDAGYALEGMSIFMEVFRQRLVESEDKE